MVAAFDPPKNSLVERLENMNSVTWGEDQDYSNGVGDIDEFLANVAGMAVEEGVTPTGGRTPRIGDK